MNRSNPSDVVIIGGGFAGCAAAMRLVREGIHPILIEFKLKLGGRATSYKIAGWPDTLDNGQHVLLGCCTETRKFLESVGASDALEWFSDLPISDGNGHIDVLRPWPVGAPLHLAPFLFRFPGLGMIQRAALAQGIVRLAFSANHDDLDWAQTARKFGQTEQIRRAFWDPFLVSALNYEPDRAAARHVRHIVQDAFWRGRGGMEIGVPRVPLLALFTDYVQHALERSSVVLKLGKRTLRLSLSPRGGFVVHLHDQSALNARKIVLATGPAIARMILEESTGVEETAEKITPVLGGSAIISIHLLYDRVMTNLPFCMVQNKMIQWIFNKGVHDGRQHLQAIISAADAASQQSQTELVVAGDVEVRQALGTDGQLVTGNAIIEKEATFPPRAGLVRPGVNASNHPDLFLAGDYVDGDWPGTIESAVRSGVAAAEAVIRSCGSPVSS